MDAVQVDTGIVGFFDILGYQNVLEHNSAGYVAQTVLKTITNMELEAETEVKRLFGSLQLGVDWHGELEKIRWLIFSDTIVVLLPYRPDPETHEDLRTLHWALFLVSSIVLYRSMFEYGLPLRGAIAFGEFATARMCFAGKPIVGAYKQGHDLDLSAIVLTDDAKNEALKVPNGPRLLEATTLDFLVRTKSEQSRRMKTLLPAFTAHPYKGEIRQIIVESFSMHGKDINPEVIPKLENTELFFRKAKTLEPKIFM